MGLSLFVAGNDISPACLVRIAIVKVVLSWGNRIMRNLIALAALIAIAAGTSAVQASTCPASPRDASLALWAGNTIPTGQTVSGTHPCGRKLTCTGGVHANFASRECHWD
jgi:hypothetical protein